MGHSLDPLDERNNMRAEGLDDSRRDAVRGSSDAGSSGLRVLSDVDDLDIAEGEPDIRGWKVQGANGEHLGEVEDLIVDLAAMKVRYMAVELDKDTFGLDDSRCVLVPIGTARLNDDDDIVMISAGTVELASMPPYDDDMFDDESALHEQYGRPYMTATGTDALTQDRTSTSDRDDMYRGEHFDDSALRRQDRQDASYLRRHEEELRIGKQQVEAGEVNLRKSVETEHVSQRVPVRREEVEIERRPISADSRSTAGAQIGDEDEIRIPLMAEEVVTEKRVVPKEEIVIRKRIVEGEETVEADLRRERIDIDEDSKTRRMKGTDAGDELR